MLHPPLATEQVAAPHRGAGERRLVYLSKLIDAVSVAGLLAAVVGVYVSPWDERYMLAALLASMLFVFIGEFAGLYRPWRGESMTRQFFEIATIWGGTLLVLFLLAYAFKTSSAYSRVVVMSWVVLTPLALSGWRALARRVIATLAQREGFQRNAVVFGCGNLAEQLADTIRTCSWLGLRLVDYVDDAAAPSPPALQGAASGAELTVLDRIEAQARRGAFDILYVALPTSERERITDLLERLSDTTVTVYMVPDYFTSSLFHGKWGTLEGIPVISVFETPFWGADGWLKRAQDLVLGSLILALMAIPMLVIAIAIKLSSPGPVLFKQRRYGIDGREIQVWKFRSMRVCEDGPNVPQARKNDVRVTKVGAFLRRTSLDELPQFFNVLRGEMSVVGPRPHAVAHNELYRKQIRGYMLRHKVKPGITGWAQINGWRGETDTELKMHKRIEHDLWYIRNWSFWLDLKIVLLTAIREFRSPNAY